MTNLIFTQADAWNGGFYELALEVGPTSDTDLRKALEALWKYPSLTGCFLRRDQEPDVQERVDPTQISFDLGARLLGLAHLPNGNTVACGSGLVREENGPDWLDFYLPMGSLSQAYDVGAYPFDEPRKSPDPWQKPIDQWLAEIGSFVFSRAHFQLGLIGMEVSGEAYADQLRRDGIPKHREIGYLWPSEDKLEYLPKQSG